MALMAAALVVPVAAPSPVAADPPPAAGVVAVGQGNSHSCALRANGTVRCWGSNPDGVLGLGADDNYRVPWLSPGLSTVDLGTGRTATDLTVSGNLSDSYNCVILDNGAVKCWGGNDFGQLGLDDTEIRGDEPGEMGDGLPNVSLGTGRTATAISVAYSHTCALLDNGAVKCWGNNQYGQLGLGDTQARGDGWPGGPEMGDLLPAVNLGTGRTAEAISVSPVHTCALLDNGDVKCWGRGVGVLGLGDTANRGDGPGEMGDNLPSVDLGTGRTAVAISAGGPSCAILDDGSLKCWGPNSDGQLGLGDTATRGDAPGEMGDALPAVDLGTGRSAVAVSAAGSRVCVVLDDATVKCWGSNVLGALGLGNIANRGDGPGEMGDSLPSVDLGTGRTASSVGAGAAAHACAVLDNGTLKCWGRNYHGQAGVDNGGASIGDGPGEMGDSLPIVVLDASPTVSVTADESSVAAGGSVHVHVTVTNPGDQALTGVTVDGGNATGCDTVIASLGAGAQQTINCTHVTTGMDLPSFTATASVTSTQTPTAVSSTQLTVPVTLSPTIGAVAGTVRETGTLTPIAGGLVALLAPADYSLVGYANARANGTYSTVAPPGNYYVYALDPAGAHLAGFVGSPNQVAVTGGTTTTVNPTLAPAAGGFSGTVTETGTNTPINNVVVVSLSTGTGQPGAGGLTNGSGAYTVGPLPAGSRLGVFVDLAGAHATEFYNDSPGIAGALPISVSGATTTGINAALAPTAPPGGGAIIQGSVTDTVTNAGLGGVAVIALRAVDFVLVGGTITGSGGTYNLAIPPGSYKLAFFPLAGSHSMEWHAGQPPSGLGSATSVAAVAGAPATVDADLDPSTGTAAGTVTEVGTGDPLADVWVIAISATGNVRAATTAADGGYSIAGLAPGAYRLRFVDPTDTHTAEWHLNAPDPGSATPTTVTGGQTTTTDAALEP